MVTSQVFTTTDTPLAAFLAISQVKLLDMNVHVYPTIYTFETNGMLDDLVRQWESELSPFRQFYNTYRSFIRQIKEKDNA